MYETLVVTFVVMVVSFQRLITKSVCILGINELLINVIYLQFLKTIEKIVTECQPTALYHYLQEYRTHMD